MLKWISAAALSCLLSLVIFIGPASQPTHHEIVASADSGKQIAPPDDKGQLVDTLNRRIVALEGEVAHLQQENADLKNRTLNVARLEMQPEAVSGGDQFSYSNPREDATVQKKESLLDKQTSEVYFSRQLQVFNYKNNELHNFSWTVPYSVYAKYRNNPDAHGIPTVKGKMSAEYYQQALSGWTELAGLAKGLRTYSGEDDELYANMVLQVTHQFAFMPTDFTKHPIETFVEGTGDCDSLAVFAAALLKAGGLDSGLIYGTVKSTPDAPTVGHALIGVKLPELPDDMGRHANSLNENGEVYYVAEPTWEKGVFVKPWEYVIPGSAVGDLCWTEFSGTLVRVTE